MTRTYRVPAGVLDAKPPRFPSLRLVVQDDSLVLRQVAEENVAPTHIFRVRGVAGLGATEDTVDNTGPHIRNQHNTQ